MKESLAEQVLDQLQTLPPEHQRRVLDFARALGVASSAGVPGKTLMEFAGTIPINDLKRMSQAIEEGCEQVDPNGW
jgi:hypothetical protein